MSTSFNTTPAFLACKTLAAPFSQLSTSKTCHRYFLHANIQPKRRIKRQYSTVRASTDTINELSVNGGTRMNVRKQKSGFTGSFEANLRFKFMEEIMQCARNGDVRGANEIMCDMIAVGLPHGPHSFHGLIVAYVLADDAEGAMQSLRKEASLGLRPLEETFVAIIRLFGSKGHDLRGEEILATMESFKFDIRRAWLVLVEELYKAGYLKEANEVFLKGGEGGLRGTDRLYDLLIEENCKAGDHANALDIALNMEAYGRMATTYHFNCLLSLQATSGIPEFAASTFENMQCGEDFMKPDTETYNWVIQAHTRANEGDRCQDIIELVGHMVEDYKRVQPNVKTYALLVECFTKYCVINEALRHFRALKRYPGAMKVLYNDGKHGDPLSVYLRALCREGRAVELLEGLESMASDNQSIAPRAMIVNRKGRTLVSSWIEPLQEEAELGFEVDYMARYIAEGGLTGERKRWVPREPRGRPLDPDCEGFFYNYPIETSYKQRCLENWKDYNGQLMGKLYSEGVQTLGPDATPKDSARVMGKLLENYFGDVEPEEMKPKSASKMLVFELKEELSGQGLPTHGNRKELYQRVQKARKINISQGQPLWVPPPKKVEIEVDEELDELISRLQVSYSNDHTEYWRKRFRFFTGEIVEEDGKQVQQEATVSILSEVNHDEATETKVRTDDEDEDEGEVEDDEDGEDGEEENKVEALDGAEDESSELPPVLISQQLKGGENKQEPPMKIEMIAEERDAEEWYVKATTEELCKFLKNEMRFDDSEMYTIEDAWGWTWEKEHRSKVPERWTQEKEVELAMKIMEKVIELGGTPTIGDCAMILNATMRAPLPTAMVSIIRRAHGLGYVFGSPLYDKVISHCIALGEQDAAIAIVTDLETAGISVPNATLDKVLHEVQEDDPTEDS